MGVIGLTGFINSNLELLTTEFELKNTILLFDGSALLRFFFYNSKQAQLDCQFGGNYVDYAKTVTQFFQTLEMNNVQSYVIFQGSQNYGITEESTVIKGKEQVTKLRTLAECSKQFGAHDFKFLGVEQGCQLADKVLTSVLDELDVPHIRTVGFSDEIVANLARKLNCPIFSDDSNFYLCGLPGGFINGNLFRFNCDNQNGKVIKCQLYRRCKFLELFELDVGVLPVLSCVMGNNFRKRDHRTDSRFKLIEDPFCDLIPKLKLDKKVSVPNLVTETRTQERVERLIHWLHGHTLKSAVEEFLRYVDDERLRRRFLRDISQTIVKVRLISDPWVGSKLRCYWRHLHGESCKTMHAMLVEDGDDKVLNIILSETFGVRFMQECWMKDLVDIRALHILKPVLVMDDYRRPSPFKYSRRLSLCLAALLNYHEADDITPLTMFDWYRTEDNRYEFVGKEYTPLRTIGDVKIPTLKKVSIMSSNRKRKVLFAMLDASLEDFFATELKVIEIHGLEDIEEIEVLSLIVLILHYMKKEISEDLRQIFPHFASAITGSVTFYMGQDNELLRQLESNRRLGNQDRLDCLYLFNIFQRMVQLFDQANQIFGYPLPEVRVHKYFNGVLVANLYHAYKTIRSR
ncbi:Protein asteroid -like protein 1 [Halotydeus destructor]|nr:Protein asteroid -like protein 1 [Halotydeus destructor]